jgi:hypothetical protein
MRSLALRLLFLATACLALVPASAGATKRPKFPVVTSVSPKVLGIGDTMTIVGRGFRAGTGRNTVVFKRDGARAVFAKSGRSTKKKIAITVPDKLRPYLVQQGEDPAPTRFRIRVLTTRLGERYTDEKDSPIIGPSAVAQGAAPNDCDGDKIPNDKDTDDDNDLRSDADEKSTNTDACKADTDGDGISDTFEYYSALDLNFGVTRKAVPYPGKRPYPNPLDPSDANLDFDQDALTLKEEYQAWVYTGSPETLSYSDGTKYTGGRLPAGAVDFEPNGYLSDDEKDVDGDGLTNWDETHGRMLQSWWVAKYDATNDVKESKYPGPDYLEPSFVDPDTDGDGVLDGDDDQDHDGYSNAFEVARPGNWKTTYVSTAHPGTSPLARVQPFNPCKPIYSDACHAHPPFSYYDPTEDWASPYHTGDPGT